jgi:hypothetical protein
MDESFAALVGAPDWHGAVVLLAITVVAGLMRGFVGFGAGMVFVPVAAAVVGPVAAVGLIWTIDAPVTFRLSVDAVRGARWDEIVPLVVGLLCGLPLGMLALTRMDPTAARWATAIFILASVVMLASGWRYRSQPTVPVTAAVGFVSGLSTGLVGLGGPFIALFWLGGLSDAERIKQNLNAYFLVTTVTVGPAFLMRGIITLDLIRDAILLTVVYTATTLLGVFAFRHGGRGSYRGIALVIAAAAAVVGMPALDPWLR